MKVQTTAIVAIVAVFAIVLASASGITYSWFTDSDDAEIDVSTAKVQMDVTFQYLDADGVWKDFDKNNVDKQVLTIENLAPGQSYYMRAVYSNNVSTIETAHKLYATISGDISADMTQNVKFNDEGVRVGDFDISGDSYDVIPVGGLPGLTDGTIYYHSFKLVAGTDWSVGSSGFKLTVKSDLVQVDKVISKVPVIDGEATTKVFDSNGSIPANVKFIDLNATDAYLEVKITENAGVVTDDLIISFKLDSATVADVGFTKAIVTMIVPGDFSNGKVIYLKEGDSDTKSQPTVTALNYDSALDITTVVFTTDYFSDFAMIDCDADNDSELSALLETIKKNDALWNTPLDIKLGDGIYSKEYTINEYPEWNGVADGNYQTTVGKPCLQLTFTGDDVTFTNLVTVNGAGTGVNGTGLSNGDAYVTFNGITFDAKDCVSGDDRYSVKMYAGAHEITFNDCEFINATHVIIGGNGQNSVDLITFNNCTIDACLSGYYYTLVVDDCVGTINDRGIINSQKGGYVDVKITNSEFTIINGEYAIRTANTASTEFNGLYYIHATTLGVYSKVGDELESSEHLLLLRCPNAKIVIDGCNLEYGDLVKLDKSGDESNVVIVDGDIYDFSLMRFYNTSWYDETKTEFTLDSSEQIVGLAALVDGGNTFEGKTIKLDGDLDLYSVRPDGEPACFDPIGSYRQDKAFKGTFDGQGYTIYNMSQNTWELNNGYYYGDLGLGLFGALEDATVKNLNIDGANISGNSALCGTVAAVAHNTTFENITISNSNVADYQYYAGGIVGRASGTQTFKGITIDSSTTIAGQWGDFNNACGGIIGGASASSEIVMEDCIVECCIDTHNDVVSAYQWYTYRRAGMLIGDSNNTVDDKNVTNASAPQLTCKNVTVVYGEWSYYHYCEFAGTGYPYVRCEGGVSCDPYSNIRYGHPTDSSGNKVVDDNHTHNDGEDHMILIAFNQLYGGSSGDRYATYGGQTHDGVTIIHKIDSLGGLMDFRDSVNGGFDYSDRTVLLTSDIDLAGMEWTPIGSKSNPFKGTFDGQGNTISNLKISDGSYVGLFGYVDDATISDLKVDGVDVY